MEFPTCHESGDKEDREKVCKYEGAGGACYYPNPRIRRSRCGYVHRSKCPDYQPSPDRQSGVIDTTDQDSKETTHEMPTSADIEHKE